MSTSLVAVGAVLAARLLFLASCVDREPITRQLALGIAIANGQLADLPGAQTALLSASIRRLSDKYRRNALPEDYELTDPALWLAGSRQTSGRLARLRPISELYDSGRPNGTESDSCLAEAVRCRESAECLEVQKTGAAAGYPLTHRLLYAIVADKMACLDHNASQTHRLCSLVLCESAAIAGWGFPVEYQDLFTEQVALCGSLGYSEFLRTDWLRWIASWQLQSGCYPEPGYRGHRTSVSAAALAVGVRAAALAAAAAEPEG